MDQPETLPRALWIDYAASKSKLDLFPMFSLVDGYLRMVTVGGGERERVKCLIFFLSPLPSSSSSTADSTDHNVSRTERRGERIPYLMVCLCVFCLIAFKVDAATVNGGNELFPRLLASGMAINYNDSYLFSSKQLRPSRK